MIQGSYISCIIGITHLHEKLLYLLNQAKRKFMSESKIERKNTEHRNKLKQTRLENVKIS